jgi:hypothetical protein
MARNNCFKLNRARKKYNFRAGPPPRRTSINVVVVFDEEKIQRLMPGLQSGQKRFGNGGKPPARYKPYLFFIDFFEGAYEVFLRDAVFWEVYTLVVFILNSLLQLLGMHFLLAFENNKEYLVPNY